MRMPTVTVKNIPEDLYFQLKKTAHDNHRSINSKIIVCIEQNVRRKRLDTKVFLQKLEKLHSQISVSQLTDDFLTKAKEESRL